MSDDLGGNISRIFQHLRQCGALIADRQRSGMSHSEIEAKIGSLGLKPPDELVKLYAFCDGTITTEGEKLESIQFIPGFYWMTLDEAITVYSAVKADGRWNQFWFPIFGNGGGDFYAVVCETDSRFLGEIVGFVVGEEVQIIEFASLSALFETIERSFAERAFFCSDGHLEADYAKMRAIARSVQPGFTEHEA